MPPAAGRRPSDLALTLAILLATLAPCRVVRAQSRCGARKISAAAGAASCVLCLDARAAGKGPQADPGRAAKCVAPLPQQFSRSERKGACPGDAAAIAEGVRSFVGAVNTALDTDSANKCQAAKLEAACRKTACLAGTLARAVRKGKAVDAQKADRCRSRFAAKFAKEEARGKCATLGDAAAIETLIETFIDGLDEDVETTTTTSTTSTTTTTIAGVPCTSSDDCGPTRCCHVPSAVCCRWGRDACAGTGGYDPFSPNGSGGCSYIPEQGPPPPINFDAQCGAAAPDTCPVEAAIPIYFECTTCRDNGKPIAQLHDTATGQLTDFY